MRASAVDPLDWVSLKKLWSAICTMILVLALGIMISPLPEGTFLFSLLLGYFGYQLTGNIYIMLVTYIATFIITIVLIKKLNLIAKFKTQLEKIRQQREASISTLEVE